MKLAFFVGLIVMMAGVGFGAYGTPFGDGSGDSEENALIFRFPCFLVSHILQILSMRTNPQVATPVIERIVVYVVDYFAVILFQSKNLTIQQNNMLSFMIIPYSSHGSIINTMPLVFGQFGIIFFVHNGIFPLC